LAIRQSSTYPRSVQRAAGTPPRALAAVAQFERGLISEPIKVGPPEGAMKAPNWPDGAFAVTGEQAKAWLMADKFDRELSMENADFDENQKVLVDVFGVGDQLRAASQARPKSNDAASADAPPSEKVGGVDPNEVSG